MCVDVFYVKNTLLPAERHINVNFDIASTTPLRLFFSKSVCPTRKLPWSQNKQCSLFNVYISLWVCHSTCHFFCMCVCVCLHSQFYVFRHTNAVRFNSVIYFKTNTCQIQTQYVIKEEMRRRHSFRVHFPHIDHFQFQFYYTKSKQKWTKTPRFLIDVFIRFSFNFVAFKLFHFLGIWCNAIFSNDSHEIAFRTNTESNIKLTSPLQNRTDL